MRHKVYRILLSIFVHKIEMSQIVVLMASLVLVYRISGFFEHFKQAESLEISFISQANAQEEKKMEGNKPKKEDKHGPDKKIKKQDADEFDPLSIDENQVKILNALSNQEKNEKKVPSLIEIEKEKELLTIAQNDLAQKLSRLEKEKEVFERKKGELTKEEKENVQNIAKIYEGMKPTQSAEIFNKLELVAAVEILKHMNQKKASAMLAAMDVTKARQITFEMLRMQQVNESEQKAPPA